MFTSFCIVFFVLFGQTLHIIVERIDSRGEKMSPIIVISIISGVVLLLLVVGLPTKVFRWIGLSFMKLLIGALFLFFLNAVGNQFGLAVPINFITSAISGFLGLPGVAALAIIQLWIF